MPSVLAPISSISSQYPLHPGSLNQAQGQDKWGALDQPQPGHDLADIGATGDRNHNFDMNRLDTFSVSAIFNFLKYSPWFLFCRSARMSGALGRLSDWVLNNSEFSLGAEYAGLSIIPRF